MKEDFFSTPILKSTKEIKNILLVVWSRTPQLCNDGTNWDSEKGKSGQGWLIMFMSCLFNEYAFEYVVFKISVLFFKGPRNIFANSILSPLLHYSPTVVLFLFSAITILSSGQLILYFVATKYTKLFQVFNCKQSP